MPYAGEHAQADGYIRLAKDRSIEDKIAEWTRVAEPVTLPSAVAAISRSSSGLPRVVDPDTVTHTIAIDGSPAESGDPDGLGSTVGFFVIAAAHSDRVAVDAARSGHTVDPAALAAASHAVTVHGAVPGARVAMAGLTGLQTWRRAIDEFLFAHAVPHPGSAVSLADAYLLVNGSGGVAAHNLALRSCPECGGSDDTMTVSRNGGTCPLCGCRLYLSDSLMLHHEFNEQESNWTPLTRLMNVTERIATAGIVMSLLVADPAALAHTLIVTDGPLGVFGPQSLLSRSLAHFYDWVDEELHRQGRPPLLMVGVEKSGQFVSHAHRISGLVDPGTVLMPSVDYIRTQVLFRGSARNLYGQHEFYGRRFFFKDAAGRMRVFTILPTRRVQAYSALPASEDWASYPALGVVVDLLERYASTRYDEAFLPLVEAHAVASLPRGEGRRILDSIAQSGLDRALSAPASSSSSGPASSPSTGLSAHA